MFIDSIAYKISAKSRARKWQQFLDIIAPEDHEAIIDVGVNTTEYSAGDNYLESHYDHPEKITSVGLGTDFEHLQTAYPKVKFVSGDGRHLPFPDQAFDIAYSNAVIEHVGTHSDQLNFLSELARVGKRGYFTTPNRFFPIEVHTRVPLLHLLLPKSAFDWFLRLIGKDWATGNYMHLLSRKDLQVLLTEAHVPGVIIANRFFGIPLTYTVYWNHPS